MEMEKDDVVLAARRKFNFSNNEEKCMLIWDTIRRREKQK